VDICWQDRRDIGATPAMRTVMRVVAAVTLIVIAAAVVVAC
jgi:hypothetical protein